MGLTWGASAVDQLLIALKKEDFSILEKSEMILFWVFSVATNHKLKFMIQGINIRALEEMEFEGLSCLIKSPQWLSCAMKGVYQTLENSYH